MSCLGCVVDSFGWFLDVLLLKCMLLYFDLRLRSVYYVVIWCFYYCACGCAVCCCFRWYFDLDYLLCLGYCVVCY